MVNEQESCKQDEWQHIQGVSDNHCDQSGVPMYVEPVKGKITPRYKISRIRGAEKDGLI